jgi:hypothetical protein
MIFATFSTSSHGLFSLWLQTKIPKIKIKHTLVALQANHRVAKHVVVVVGLLHWAE